MKKIKKNPIIGKNGINIKIVKATSLSLNSFEEAIIIHIGNNTAPNKIQKMNLSRVKIIFFFLFNSN